MGRPKKDWTGSRCKSCPAKDVPINSSGECRKCYQKAYDKAKYDADPAAQIAKVRKWAKENPERVRENRRNSYAKDPKRVQNRNKAYAEAHHDEVLARHKAWRDRRRMHVRAKDAAKKYEITYDGYLAMFESQRGLCAICGESMNPPCVDHDHETNKVRQMLCHHCNVVAGHIEKKGVENTLAVQAYLERHKQ